MYQPDLSRQRSVEGMMADQQTAPFARTSEYLTELHCQTASCLQKIRLGGGYICPCGHIFCGACFIANPEDRSGSTMRCTKCTTLLRFPKREKG